MKKITLCVLMAFVAVCAQAQFMRSEELEAYAKEKYGDSWVEAAANLRNEVTLDKNNSLTYVQVIDCGEKTKDQLYVILNYWVSSSFNDANSVIQLNDKESGTIICQGYVSGIAANVGGMNTYVVNIKPVIKVDIKDKKIRVTYSVGYYDVDRTNGALVTNRYGNPVTEQKWPLEKCYPFVEKDKHKKTSSKALIMTHAYSNVIMDKIEEAVKNGLVGNETEDW